ncbi:MarR family winged helix-turn-helix transcriptional regulator [Alienimonas californiensis]|uniref:Transcriptional regulator SlyA n=1 Tax=Alienimonas californiensis TaxID=2527989 RepID=A0A517P6H1_9PLAN|nr:MarR family transcriptional regulator [Alienimonas californiensis]QDT14976.1 transcriptional regulator SlyA [Alienimonas californiensis]
MTEPAPPPTASSPDAPPPDASLAGPFSPDVPRPDAPASGDAASGDAAPGDAAGPEGSAPTGLAADLGKRLPFQHAEEEAYLNLIRSADVLARQFDELFKSRGLSQPLYNCLRILVGAETVAQRCDRTRFHGLAIKEIGDRLVTHAPDVTRLADRLERLGLAERRRCSEDRRSVRVFPTDKARTLLAELAEPILALHRTQLGHLGPEKLAQLSGLLEEARRGGE